MEVGKDSSQSLGVFARPIFLTGKMGRFIKEMDLFPQKWKKQGKTPRKKLGVIYYAQLF
jgi:hypothetical protein